MLKDPLMKKIKIIFGLIFS